MGSCEVSSAAAALARFLAAWRWQPGLAPSQLRYVEYTARIAEYSQELGRESLEEAQG